MNKPIPQIDHAKQRQKLQDLVSKMMSSGTSTDADIDIVALYDGLNPSKRHLLPLEYQAILKNHEENGKFSTSVHNRQPLAKLTRPPSG
jgi:hypothetical protein